MRLCLSVCVCVRARKPADRILPHSWAALAKHCTINRRGKIGQVYSPTPDKICHILRVLILFPLTASCADIRSTYKITGPSEPIHNSRAYVHWMWARNLRFSLSKTQVGRKLPKNIKTRWKCIKWREMLYTSTYISYISNTSSILTTEEEKTNEGESWQ